MSTNYSVAIQYKKELGYIEYDAKERTATVVLDDAKGRRAVEAYLGEKHEIGVPHETLRDFSKELIDPVADVESFKTALTRLWEATDVHVDWSRPVEYVKEHRRY
ncbi:hypothetical protein [Selenomonas sp.]|uniref:hypothetical protein n=1 Tax=Selenomonas sp. TaxID=2053611 RepID=UPI003FA2FDC2